jgi:hypothetical protein
LTPSQYVWFGAGLVAIGFALYVSFSRLDRGGAIMLAVLALSVYRRIRNRPQRMQEAFVRRVAKIPEVRLVTLQGRQFTVVVDRPVAQLYARINQQLQNSNRKLYFGEPMTVSILHSVSAEKTQQLLAGPGVQHLREDVLRQP